jgi:hypothetical protein
MENLEEFMTEQKPTLSRHDLEAKIVKRCWEDEEFRKEFTADPAGTFAKHLAVPAANLPRIAVHEETPGSWHIVLPVKPSNTNELSEADLERVAGGTATPVIVTTVAAVSAAATVASVSLAASIPLTLDKGW